ncbi:MAG: hypothetical protein AAGM67_00225, partial [Bacteroidota bacterium]
EAFGWSSDLVFSVGSYLGGQGILFIEDVWEDRSIKSIIKSKLDVVGLKGIDLSNLVKHVVFKRPDVSADQIKEVLESLSEEDVAVELGSEMWFRRWNKQDLADLKGYVANLSFEDKVILTNQEVSLSLGWHELVIEDMFKAFSLKDHQHMNEGRQKQKMRKDRDQQREEILQIFVQAPGISFSVTDVHEKLTDVNEQLRNVHAGWEKIMALDEIQKMLEAYVNTGDLSMTQVTVPRWEASWETYHEVWEKRLVDTLRKAGVTSHKDLCVMMNMSKKVCTKILHNLEVEGAIERTSDGWQMNPKQLGSSVTKFQKHILGMLSPQKGFTEAEIVVDRGVAPRTTFLEWESTVVQDLILSGKASKVGTLYYPYSAAGDAYKKVWKYLVELGETQISPRLEVSGFCPALIEHTLGLMQDRGILRLEGDALHNVDLKSVLYQCLECYAQTPHTLVKSLKDKKEIFLFNSEVDMILDLLHKEGKAVAFEGKWCRLPTEQDKIDLLNSDSDELDIASFSNGISERTLEFKTGWHPEILNMALDSLEREDLIKKDSLNKYHKVPPPFVHQPTPELEAVITGYHKKQVQRGVLGEFSKIREEFEELEDAVEQDAKVLIQCELADLLGAIEFYIEQQFPGLTLDDIIKMKQMTRASFERGIR